MRSGFRIFIFYSFFVIHSFCFSQIINSNSEKNRTADSLLFILKTGKNDTCKINALNILSRQLAQTGKYDSAFKLAEQAKNIGIKILSKLPGVKKGLGTAYNNIGLSYYYRGNYPEALNNYFISKKIREEIGDKKGIAFSYNNIGLVYAHLGNYPEALKNHFAALKIREEIADKSAIAGSYNNIGNIYYSQRNYADALKNQEAALKAKLEAGDKHGIAASYNNIGSIFQDQLNYPGALQNYSASLKVMEEIGDKRGEATCYINIGISTYELGNDQEALKHFFAALKISEAIGDRHGVGYCNANIGNVYMRQKKYKRTENYLKKALAVFKETGEKECMKVSYKALSDFEKTQENFKKAYENHKLYILYRDSLVNEENTKKTVETQMQYEFNKKEHNTKLLQEKKDMKDKANKQQQRLFLIAVAFVLLLVILLAGFIFRALQITRKQKQLIESQKKIVEDHQKEILDSIRYAKRIQTALLPNEKFVNKTLNRLGRS